MSKTVASFPAVRPRGAADITGLYAADGGRKYLSAAERARALAVMAALPSDKALFALTLAWSGARVSEVLALTPASFQIERGIAAITTLKRRRHVVREVPLPPFLTQAIDAHFDLARRQRDEAVAQRRLWTWHRATAWRIVKRVMIEAQITGRASSPRGLRHAFGVGAIQADVPLTLVQRWLGHARLSTTAIYTDASGPEERVLAERFWDRTAKSP